MTPAMRATVVSIVLATAGACSSGGGGGGGPPPPPPPSTVGFTSFGAITPNQTVIMDGTAVTARGNQTSTAITSMTIDPVSAGTVNLSYDGSRALRAISVNTPQSSVSFDRNTPGHSVSCSGATCVAANPSASAVAIDAFAVGWNYQSFGVWGVDTSPSTFSLGAISVGNPTSGNSLPITGTALFTGLAAGFFFNSSGTPFATAASMSANVDFSARNIAFSTSNTSLVNVNNGAQTTDNALNLTGTLSYLPGTNAFSGTLNTGNGANGQLSGQGSGRFYGPAAEEMGGVYSLSGSGLSRMVGGFGGKR